MFFFAGISSPFVDKKEKDEAKSAKKLEKELKHEHERVLKEKLRFGSLDAESIKPTKSNFFRTVRLFILALLDRISRNTLLF